MSNKVRKDSLSDFFEFKWPINYMLVAINLSYLTLVDAAISWNQLTFHKFNSPFSIVNCFRFLMKWKLWEPCTFPKLIKSTTDLIRSSITNKITKKKTNHRFQVINRSLTWGRDLGWLCVIKFKASFLTIWILKNYHKWTKPPLLRFFQTS